MIGKETVKKKKKQSTGISNSGNKAEDLFGRLTNLERASKRAIGDFIHQGVPIEVKKVTADENSGNGTINQVRAAKNSVLVIYVANRKEWFILDSKSVLQTVARLKKRGQHNENPFECCNLSIRNIEKAGFAPVSNKKLKDEVLRAVRRTKGDKSTKDLTLLILEESRSTAEKHRKMVKKALKISDAD